MKQYSRSAESLPVFDMKTLRVSYAFLLLMLGCFFHTSEGKCPGNCGNVTISYPFGIGSGCSLPGFKVICNNNVPTLVNASGLEIIKIVNPDQVWLKTDKTLAYECYQHGTAKKVNNNPGSVLLDYPFTISGVWNRFVSMGCDTKANITNHNNTFHGTCVSKWINGGIGHCQSSIPSGYLGFRYNVTNLHDYTKSSCVNDCSFAVLVKEGHKLNVSQLSNSPIKLPLIADWAIDTVAKCPSITQCGENAICNSSRRGVGYLCTCKNDYNGNPYRNVIDGGCRRRDGRFPAVPVALAGGFALAATLAAASWGYGSSAQKKISLLKQATDNGSKILQELINNGGDGDPSAGDTGGPTESTAPEDIQANNTEQGIVDGGSSSAAAENPKIFNSEQIQQAVKLFQKSQNLGRRMLQGRVRVGTLPTQQKVSIREFEIEDKNQTQLIRSFMVDVCTLTQIDHSLYRNVAKLLGCCLETKAPSLVYEYFSDQTLFDHIHNTAHLPWEHRLRIAAKTSKLLDDLHSHEKKILHRDLKSSNILVDTDYNVKVVDFGVARLLHSVTHMNRSVGYVDPEYCHTSQLTEKSDVYSFGVVLIELLTGKDPSSKDYQMGSSLAMYFISEMKKNRLKEVLEVQIWNEASEQELQTVAELAVKCAELKGEERPTMKEVANTLSFAIPEEQEQVEEETTGDGGEGWGGVKDQVTGYVSTMIEEMKNVVDSGPNV